MTSYLAFLVTTTIKITARSTSTHASLTKTPMNLSAQGLSPSLGFSPSHISWAAQQLPLTAQQPRTPLLPEFRAK